MSDSQSNILRSVNDYYSAKIREYGQCPHGVDWNGEESQRLRFKQLLKIVEKKSNFSIIDVGCGYGALVDYLQKSFKKSKQTHFASFQVREKQLML